MLNFKTFNYLLVLVFFALLACTKNGAKNAVVSDDILINQVGYITDAAKYALLRVDADEFFIQTKEGKTVYKGESGAWKSWELSGDSVRLADFTAFKEPGEYVLLVNDSLQSYPFTIADELFGDLADAALKSYYYARCSQQIDSVYGGKWHREAGHPDTSVMVHPSAADKIRPEGTLISSPGGWYDAGDYGKYIVNSGITTYTLLLSNQLNSEYHKNQHLNIPESDNELPDILDETLVNLKWMLTMQDPNDGGVYHKLTTKNFTGFVMPSETNEQRYVVQKSTAATLDFAATMAHASVELEKAGLSELAAKTRESAKAAWKWALLNPDILYRQPADVSTGAYGDRFLKDEWFWAAAEMYLLEGDQEYLDLVQSNYQKPVTPKWNVVQTLGLISLLNSDKRSEFSDMEADFIAHVDLLLKKEKNAPYVVSINEFAWGSNSDVANDGVLKLIAFKLTGDEKYINSARNDLDYLLGRNATGFCFVSGFGEKSPLYPHNRISSADGIDEPVPGFLAGGPNIWALNDCEPQKVERSKFPATSYVDVECSYSTNETAINWNAPLVFLVSGLDDLDRN